MAMSSIMQVLMICSLSAFYLISLKHLAWLIALSPAKAFFIAEKLYAPGVLSRSLGSPLSVSVPPPLGNL
jgi:hypothetical protein